MRQFGDFSRLKLELPPIFHDMIVIAVNAENSMEGSPLSKTQIIDVRYPIICSERSKLQLQKWTLPHIPAPS